MKGRAAVRYSSCQAGTGSEECVGKNSRLFFFCVFFLGSGGDGGGGGVGAVTADVVFVVLSGCCLVRPSASLFTVQFLNRWRPVSWWSWEEVEEGSCWAEEVEDAAGRQKNSELEFALLPFFNRIMTTFGFARNSKSSGFKAAIAHTLTDLFLQGTNARISLHNTLSFKVVTVSD